jgi:hypothetical protein
MSYQKVIDLLAETKKQLAPLLTRKEDEHHRLKLESDLQRNITYLSLLTTATDPSASITPEKLGPAKTIAGKPIVVNERVKVEDLEPHAEKVQVLRNKVEAAYPRFLKMESQFILNEFEENVIRGVAKKAKMKVTAEEPEKITLPFIDEIKENIKLMAQRDQDMNKLKEESANVSVTEEKKKPGRPKKEKE